MTGQRLEKVQRDAFAGKCDELDQKNFARGFTNRAAAKRLDDFIIDLVPHTTDIATGLGMNSIP